MNRIPTTTDQAGPAQEPGWRELWLKEDWWAVWLGLGLVIAALALFARGSSVAWIAVAPAKWSTFPELGGQLVSNAPRYLAQLGLFLVIFGGSCYWHIWHGGPGNLGLYTDQSSRPRHLDWNLGVCACHHFGHAMGKIQD